MADCKKHFIVIDDNKLDCFIAEKVIRNTGLSETVHSFYDARLALEFITNNIQPGVNDKVIIVDIQMPIMNGFQFVEAFESLPDEVLSQYQIFMLSSSINENDLSMVRNFRTVRQLLNKPLTSEKLSTLVGR